MRSRPPTSTRPVETGVGFPAWRAIRFGFAVGFAADSADANIHDFDGGTRGGMSESSAMRRMKVGDESRRERDFEFVRLPAIAHVGPQFVSNRARSFGGEFGARATNQSRGAREQISIARIRRRAP